MGGETQTPLPRLQTLITKSVFYNDDHDNMIVFIAPAIPTYVSKEPVCFGKDLTQRQI